MTEQKLTVQDRLASYADLQDKPNRVVHGHSTKTILDDAQAASATIELQRREIERLAALVPVQRRPIILSAILAGLPDESGAAPSTFQNFLGLWVITNDEAATVLDRFAAAALQAFPGYVLHAPVGYREITPDELATMGVVMR